MMDREQLPPRCWQPSLRCTGLRKPCSAVSMTVQTRRSRQSCGPGSSWIRCAARGISKRGWSAYSSTSAARYCAVSSGLRRMSAAITALEETLRLPVELYYLEGFKTREIAGMLGIPENTVKTRLRAAREHLRKDLKGACFA